MSEAKANDLENLAADRAYKAGLGAGEWESFLSRREFDQLARLARRGFGTWGREKYIPTIGPIAEKGAAHAD